MAVAVWYVAVHSALLSAVASVVALSTTTELHRPSDEQRPSVSPTAASAANHSASRHRPEVSTLYSGTAPTATLAGGFSAPLKDIWLIGLFPLEGSWAGGLGQLPAVQMGIEDVNADPDVLPGYRLRMTMDDTAVSCAIITHFV